MEVAKLEEDDKATSLLSVIEERTKQVPWNLHLSKIYDSIVSLTTPWSRTEKEAST